MPRKTEEQINREVLADINGENKSVWQDMKENWQKLTRRQKVGFVAGTIAVLGVLGKTGEMDYESEQLTQQNDEQIMEHARNAGNSSAENFIPQKGGGPLPSEAPVKGGPEDETLSFDNPESEETETYENSEAFKNGGGMPDLREEPSNPEAEIYENSEEFTNNDGHKAAKIEREVNNPEG